MTIFTDNELWLSKENQLANSFKLEFAMPFYDYNNSTYIEFKIKFYRLLWKIGMMTKY